MLYVFCAAQVFTVISLLVLGKWVLDHLSKNEERTTKALLDMVSYIETNRMSTEKQIQAVLERAFRERELLLERVQHPEHTQAQAAGATGTTGISVLDEEGEAREEGLIDEDEDEEDTQVLKPLKPVQPVGG